MKGKGHQFAVSGFVSQADRFSRKAKEVKDYLEVQCKDHNVDFVSNKNISPRSLLNQDCLHLNRKGQYMMGTNFSIFFISFYFQKLIPKTSTGMSEVVFLIVRIQKKQGKSSKMGKIWHLLYT